MSRIARLLRQAAAGANVPLDIADAFSTDLYTGNSSTQTITNGIDLAGEGGLVWVKCRSGSSSDEHALFDTLRGSEVRLATNSTASEANYGASDGFGGFSSTGFSLTADVGYYVNQSPRTYAAWTFRRAPKFFDIVTYTGDGTAGRTIAHSLGIEPGMIVVKRLDSAASWYVYNRGYPSASGQMESTSAFTANALGGATDTDFTTGSFAPAWNVSGGTYVAYLFAHDPSPDGIIQCGSYTGNGSTSGPTITLGWAPQYVLVKNTDAAASWWVHDTTRGVSAAVNPNTNGAETTGLSWFNITSTGFDITSTSSNVNNSGQNYIYMAIRAEGV